MRTRILWVLCWRDRKVPGELTIAAVGSYGCTGLE